MTDSQTYLTLAGLQLNLSDIPLPEVTVRIGRPLMRPRCKAAVPRPVRRPGRTGPFPLGARERAPG
ncbi:hypothetical protein Snoj_00870 [Streptomyces nojiriensis]|uniref:Uncharacterized protein n=1 Tax=Streptomyces nojiriensis TaxID=66374 RepID=A0ABQ3SDG3_9ACTN|nr:hypothetical protein GCM10010205_75920 [Streptomyces nojiriensis]GHI66169.1 hypothetical protein Snoj_00870 [Streptomyces nojiriensis]